jgi:hypothetical protein
MGRGSREVGGLWFLFEIQAVLGGWLEVDHEATGLFMGTMAVIPTPT